MSDLSRMPIITIKLEQAARELVSAFIVSSHEVNKELEKQLQVQMKSIKVEEIFNDALKKGIGEAVKRSVDSYFQYGHGRKFIEDAVDDAFNKALHLPTK